MQNGTTKWRKCRRGFATSRLSTLLTPAENVEIPSFEMILEHADGEHVVQMNAFTKHPHEHRSDAELKENHDGWTKFGEYRRFRRRFDPVQTTYHSRRRTVILFHLDSSTNERTSRSTRGERWVFVLPVIDNSTDDLNENSEEKVDVDFRSTAVQRSENRRRTNVDEKFSVDHRLHLNPKKIKSERRTLMNETDKPTNSIIRVA